MIVGGIGGGMLEAETWFWRREREGVDDPDLRTALRSVLPFAHAEVVARRCGTTGPRGDRRSRLQLRAARLGLAAELIASGDVPLALAGGVDAMTRICFMGFKRSKLLDPEPCRPFARDRRGMSLGEGAGFVVLEDEAHARARGAPAAMRSWPATASPRMPGTSRRRTPMGRAASGRWRRRWIGRGSRRARSDHVNAHGTGTPQNDRVEAAALHKLFDRTRCS